jgi:hypothetical protein
MSEQREKFVDDLLDKALANYSQAEARMGLEGRVLARLEEEKAASPRGWWRWAWVPAAAVALIAGGLYLARPKPQAPTASSVAVKSGPAVQTATATRPQAQRRAESRPRLVEAAAKPAQFPAPAPLSEQERLLLAYVKLQPQAAAEQAKAAGEPLVEMKIEPLEIQPLEPDGN